MLKISLNNIKKYYGDRLLFECAGLSIYSGEKVAIAGTNGAGKTTLLDIIAGIKTPDEGFADIRGEVSYARQLDGGDKDSGRPDERNTRRGGEPDCISCKIAGEFGAPAGYETHLSGGEKTRRRIASALENPGGILLLDEPTSNLDISAIKLLEEKLDAFDGTLIIVSHDRALLDKVCTRVIEIENSNINDFDGNFASYEYQKKLIFERAGFEREKYLSEKKRLERAVIDKKQRSKQMKKTPKRMGNSEARLHTRAVNSKKKKLDGAADALKSRLARLEVKEKPYCPPEIKIGVPDHERIHSRAAASCGSLSKSFGGRILFDGAAFELPSGAKTALSGPNGSGKTTLVRMMLGRENGIWVSERARIGYFSQDLETLDCEKTILENVSASSAHPETTVRTLLACLLFRRDEVYKKAAMLSGGERVKTAIAKILLGGFNFLVLDEPTNYLDIFSLAALEGVLRDYDGAMLLCSHDRRFINAVADRCLIINEKNGKIITYEGKYADYERKYNTIE
jgi:macrolide transport system ATP-binding/permease protein